MDFKEKLKISDWRNPTVGAILVDDKEKVCEVQKVEEGGLVMRLLYRKPHWGHGYGVWVRRSGLDNIDWEPILYGNRKSAFVLAHTQRPMLKNIQKLREVQKKLLLVQEEKPAQVSTFRPKRMIQI